MTLILICDMILVKIMMMLLLMMMMLLLFLAAGRSFGSVQLITKPCTTSCRQKTFRKCICLILENMICRSFKFNVSFSITQSTPFIADTGGTLSQCPHYRTPVIAED